MSKDELNEDLKLKREQNKKRKWKFLIGCFLLLIAIGIGLYFGYRKLNSNPVAIYKNTINSAYNYASKYLKNYKKNEFSIDYNNDAFVLSLDTTLVSNIKELRNFSDKTYNLELGLDNKNKIATLKALINEDNEEIINVLGLIKDSKAYIKSTEIIDKVLNLGDYDLFSYIDLNFDSVSDSLYNYNYEDFDYILKSLKNSYLASLDKTKFSITNETITIDDKTFDSKKIVYLLDKENALRTSKYILNDILKDNKMLEALGNVTGYSEEKIKSYINECLDDLDISDFEDLEMVVNTDKFNNFLGGYVADKKGNLARITLVDKKLNIKIMDSNNTLVYETKDNKRTLEYLYNSESIIKLIFNDNNDDLNMDYDINIEDFNVNGNITIKDVINTKSKIGCAYKISFQTSIDDINLDLEGNVSLEKKELDVFDTRNSVKIEDLSEEDLTKMYVTVMDIVDRFGLSDLIDEMDNI